jgi:hypothetical protein
MNTINISRDNAATFVDKDGVLYIAWCGCVYEVVGIEEYGSWVVKDIKIK